jgi:flagella synthesis protein FlgN
MSISVVEQITAILQAELKLTTQLAELLKFERAALKKSNHQILSEITEKKQPLAMQLEQLGRQRQSVLKSSGFPAGKAGLDAFITNQNEENRVKLSQTVLQLREKAKLCRDSNHVNGGVINVNRQHLTKALAVLRGRDLDTSAYGPGGEYTSQVVRQPLLGRV